MTQFLRKLPLPAVVLASVMLGSALTASAMFQTHMWSAKNALISARTQLQEATRDKAGHREQAIDLVNRAINQVNAGIAAGAR